MVSLAERRGRSALGVYPIESSAVTSSAQRQRSAPPISNSSSLQPSSSLIQIKSLQSFISNHTNPLPDSIRDPIQSLDHIFTRLRDSVADLIADDADWLEEQYGVGDLLAHVHDQHQALVGVVLDLHDELLDWRHRSEQSAAQLDQQQRIIKSLELQSWTTPELLQKTITDLEREIDRLDPGRALIIPQTLTDIGPVQRLIALRFQRQDDLLFLMRRRLAQMSLDQPLAECLDEFRSLHAVLDELKRLRQQNAQLQLRERRFDQSTLLRRRPLQQCSKLLLQVLVVALQNELGAVHDAVAELDPGRHPLRDLLSTVSTPAVDIDLLYSELTSSTPGKHHDDDDDLDMNRIRSTLQQLGAELQTAEFVSDSMSRSARDAVSYLMKQTTAMERTLTEQHDLIRDTTQQLRDQRVLTLKLTGAVQDLLQRHDPVNR